MKRQNTRERILSTCLKLFNARGPTAVTTAEIAAAVGINEGNLYYYFKKKAEIVCALFDQFAEELTAVAVRDKDHLRGWFELMWKWRFFYRDSAAVYAMAPSLQPRLQQLSDTIQEQGRRNLRAMVEDGMLRADEAEIERLVVNAWIVSAYWIEYLQSRHGVTRLTKQHLAWGYRQMEALFEPYLTDQGMAQALAQRQEPGI